jgi:hypothetical protein
VTFIAQSVRYPAAKVARDADFGKAAPSSTRRFPWFLYGSPSRF